MGVVDFMHEVQEALEDLKEYKAALEQQRAKDRSNRKWRQR